MMAKDRQGGQPPVVCLAVCFEIPQTVGHSLFVIEGSQTLNAQMSALRQALYYAELVEYFRLCMSS